MPDLQFVLPHFAYWAGLILFPLFAMAMVAWQRRRGPLLHASLPIAYLLLITAGFVGIHRFYVRSWFGIVYLPLLFAVIHANGEIRDAREVRSLAGSDVMVAEFDVEDTQFRVDDGVAGAEAALTDMQAVLATARIRLTDAEAGMTLWSDVAGYVALAVALLLLLDAVLLPGLTRRCRAAEGDVPAPEEEESAKAKAPPRTGVFGAVDRVLALSGEFVAYWSVLAVFAYYYEVLARYLFNSPTNWVHESMFLMFGMFYLISGGYAYMTDSHVRVDIFYSRMSPRGKALTDILTSVFFFIFAGTLLVTGWIFMMDSIGSGVAGEVSITEWAIQYWPVKITIVIGAVLLLVQGLAKLAGDVAVLARGER